MNLNFRKNSYIIIALIAMIIFIEIIKITLKETIFDSYYHLHMEIYKDTHNFFLSCYELLCDLIAKPKINKRHLVIWMLNYYFICILIFFIFLILITAVIAARHIIFEIQNNHIPGVTIAWFFNHFIPG